jgi:hypothetical protein
MPEYGFAVSTILDEEADRRSVKTAIDAFFRETADSYVFYFSGHGWATDNGVYLVTHDADEVDPGIDLEWIRRLINNVTSTKATVAIILDCCHAGAASLSSSGITMRTDDLTTAFPSFPAGRVVLAACRGDQLAYEDGALGHGVFTAHLIDGLMGEAADGDGTVTVSSVYDYAAQNVARQGLQTPAFRGDFAGRFVLGVDFTPRLQPSLSEARAIEFEREAHRHLEEYQTTFAESFKDLSHWKAVGFKTACQMLDPIVAWFARRIKDFPTLRSRKTFGAHYDAVLQRVSTLCTLETEMVTTDGTVTKKGENILDSASFLL